MQTSINLQEPYMFSIIPLAVIIGIAVSMAIMYLIVTIKKKEQIIKEQVEIKAIPERNIKNMKVIRGKYIDLLESIESKYNRKSIELRKAYQLISEAMRLFVFEVTDITTQNYSLSEIKKLDLPVLYELIEEYYEPEFASKPAGDFNASINKARRVIIEWK